MSRKANLPARHIQSNRKFENGPPQISQSIFKSSNRLIFKSLLRFPAEHQHIIDIDFREKLLLALARVVGTMDELAFDADLIPLLKVFCGYIGQLAPDRNIVPLGVFYFLAFGVLVGVGGGNREAGLLRLLKHFDLRVLAQPADQRYAVS